MEEKLKAINDTKIEEAIAEAFSKLVEYECKCKIASRSYPKQGSWWGRTKTSA